MKTRVAVYEEGLFDLRGDKTFLRGGKCPLSPPPQKKPCSNVSRVMYMYIVGDI